MRSLKDYSVSFKGLKEGNHLFDYKVDAEFFGLLEDSLYEDGNLDVLVDMTKSMQLMVFDIKARGTLVTVCDNCLEPIDVPVNAEYKLFVKFGSEYDEPSDDVLVLPHEEHEINLAKVLYDVIVTSVSIRHVHQPDADGNSTCDPEMLRKLEQYVVNKGSDDDGEVKQDPRWDGLKEIIGKKLS